MSLSSSRREFLRLFGSAGVLSLSGLPPAVFSRVFAQGDALPGPDQRVLVLIQLAGGNDGLNTVVPFADDEYYRRRPGIGVPAGAVLKLNDRFGLHPSLTGLRGLFDAGRLAIVHGVGYPHPDRSHFRSMDIWHSAQPDVASPRDGWLGRALEWRFDHGRGGAEGLALGSERLPLALVSARIPVPTLRRIDDWKLAEPDPSATNRRLKRDLATKAAGKAANQELEYLRQSARTAIASAERLASLTKAYQPSAEYPGTWLAQQLKLVAQFIAAESPTRVFFVSLDGFDTHSQQQAGHAALLGELSGALAAFHADLDGHGLGDRVLTATFSEFGRRVEENGSLGTDHGAASMLFAIAPAGKGGFYGTMPDLTDLADGDLRHTTDFRQVYATCLERWLEIPSQAVLGGRFEPVPFV
jgi:uncharacterized protein (DUF1501 family)